ncbi:HAD family hydrolase [Ammoniphilus sp. 3BR4]|uniref:HAD family hydrolase n=1 Tax=Ammoniphilus sp. 3BR4 TaxID=3158265 RepID=UPI0034668F0A
MIKAIIFDFDGTILDTETASYRAWMSLYERYGFTMGIEEWGKFIGTKNKEDNPYTFIKNNAPDFLWSEEETRFEVRKTVDSLMADKEILPGVKDLIAHAKKHNIKLGIASSSARETVLEHLRRLNLQMDFDVISTSDDVRKVKPDPELYLRTIAALKMKKNEVIAIEDSPNGAWSAVRAGIRCVVVPNQMTKNLQFPEVDCILESLADFDTRLLSNKGPLSIE